MTPSPMHSPLPDVLRDTAVRLVFGPATLARLGHLAADENITRVLLVSDPGVAAAGHVQRAAASLREAGIETTIFTGVEENPTTRHVAAGLDVARALAINGIVGVGGGSSMDCAKGINFLLTNGGEMADYWGVGKATRPMLTLIAVPTTAGTGSEAQSFALITDPTTHQKMACGDKKALPRSAILDPDLTATQPPAVAAATAIDAVAHAVETAGTNKRSPLSQRLSIEAWRRLDAAFDTAVCNSQGGTGVPPASAQSGQGGTGVPPDSTGGTGVPPVNSRASPHQGSAGVSPAPAQADARADMLIGAHLAGAAIEQSMLGAAHACANPLTAHYGITHGVAVGLMLPHVVRFNAAVGDNPYAVLCDDVGALASRLELMLDAAMLPRRLEALDIPRDALPALAEEAARQWTARFNPRPVEAPHLQRIYESAFA